MRDQKRGVACQKLLPRNEGGKAMVNWVDTENATIKDSQSWRRKLEVSAVRLSFFKAVILCSTNSMELNSTCKSYHSMLTYLGLSVKCHFHRWSLIQPLHPRMINSEYLPSTSISPSFHLLVTSGTMWCHVTDGDPHTCTYLQPGAQCPASSGAHPPRS